MKEKGLLVHTFRQESYGDCTAGGVTSRYNSFVLTGVEADAMVFEPKADAPELVLIKRWIGTSEAHYAIPAELLDENGEPRTDVHICFGGNFVCTSDSRFRAATGSSRPLPVHDRADTWETYRRLSV